MKAKLEGSVYSVIAFSSDVTELMKTFPCSGLNSEADYVFQFDARNGDLVDVDWTVDGQSGGFSSDHDGPGVAALSEDACRYGAEELGLDDVLAIRYPQRGVRP